MLGFSAKFSEPLVRQLDPRIVSEAKDLLRITVQYAERLLEKTAGPRARNVAHRLVEEFPSHGFVISLDEGQRLGLPVKPIEKYDLLDVVRQYHRDAEDGEALVCFAPMEDFLPDEEHDSDDEGETNGTSEATPDEGKRSADKGDGLEMPSPFSRN
jgi:hypothetical protein